MNAHAIVMTTTDSDELTEQIASRLLDDRLAACIQVQKIQSFYRWEGEVHRDLENLLLIKGRTANFAAIQAAIVDVHTYDEPEIVQVAITNGSASYLGWIDKETTPTQR